MKKIPKILVVGSYMMDLVASTRRAPKEGETVIGMKFNMAPGGKGNNQAVQCARLGAQATMVGQVGKDAFGQKLLDGAAQAGVDISHVLVDPEEATGIAHITLEVSEHDARNRITVCPGANFAHSYRGGTNDKGTERVIFIKITQEPVPFGAGSWVIRYTCTLTRNFLQGAGCSGAAPGAWASLGKKTANRFFVRVISSTGPW